MGARLSDFERERRKAERTARSFSDEGYRHYDPDREGFGSADEWVATAERLASGSGAFRWTGGPRVEGTRSRTRVTADMLALDIDEMPATLAELVSAFRRRAMATHPDRGGRAADFKAAYAAYERLVRQYA